MNKWIIIAILLGLISSAAYFYYKTTQSKIELLIKNNSILTENNKQLTTANQENLNTIDELQAAQEKIKKDFEKAQADFQVIRQQNAELQTKLNNHDLQSLAANKAKLVENIINEATKNANRCFELLSGSPLTEKEKSAKNEKDFNNECPWLFNELISH
jgi:predicted phage tail protein